MDSAKNIQRFILLLVLGSGLLSCKKFIAIGLPQNQITAGAAFATDASAMSAMRGIYSQMISDNNLCSGGLSSMTLLAGYSADEFIYYGNNTDKLQFYSSSILSTNSLVKSAIWQASYLYINNANNIIENVQQSASISAATRNELTGEAKFVRAFCHFYLVNLFGDVPYISSTDYRVNKLAGRKAATEVYENIIADLLDAKSLLAGDYSFSNAERDQPNKWAATALLARVYLYNHAWADAFQQASLVIGNNQYNLLSDLNLVFLKNSSEAIWQLKPVVQGTNTNEGNYFNLTTPPSEVSLNPALLNSFETGDLRKANWIGSLAAGGNTYYFPTKYKIMSSTSLTEYSMVFRLAEQYLIAAEAAAQLNNLPEALQNINKIRQRAGLAPLGGSLQAGDILAAIDKERQTEYFAEWGHRWLDLKRRQGANAVLGAVKGANWQSTDQLYPVPQSERVNDPNLTQNAGY